MGAYQVDAYLPTAAASRRMIEIAVFDFLHAFARAYVLLSGYFIACGSFPLMSFGRALLYTADTYQQKDEISAGRVLCYPNITSRECLRAAFRSKVSLRLNSGRSPSSLFAQSPRTISVSPPMALSYIPGSRKAGSQYKTIKKRSRSPFV